MKNENRDLGLYVHIPFCKTKCGYCGFYSEPIEKHNSERLIQALITELGLYDCVISQTVYIGGGSPSCLPQEQLLQLIGEITSRQLDIEEFTVEVNPGQISKDFLKKLLSAGVNRLSMGAQSFNDNELVFLGRLHTSDDIKKAVDTAKQAGFGNIGLDLIFAIPLCGTGFQPVDMKDNSRLKSWIYNLKTAINLDVHHIAAYALTYEENTPLQKMVIDGKVKPIDEETDRMMYETAIDELEKAGFEQYEISNFAKPGFQCLHNLNYWANRPYIGIGPSAASYWQGKRRQNVKDIKKYIDMIEKIGSATEQTESPDKLQVACETAVLNLRRTKGINLAEFEVETGYNAMSLFKEPIERYKKLGLLDMSAGRLFLTKNALPIADSILCDFSDA